METAVFSLGGGNQDKIEQNIPDVHVLYGLRNAEKKNGQQCVGASPWKYKIAETIIRGLVSDAENENVPMAKMDDFKNMSRQSKIPRHALNN